MAEHNFNFTMRELLEAGVHFGHRKNFWNPKMAKYLYGVRNGVHIFDLNKTVPSLKIALNTLKEVASNNGKVLFVGTKRQATEVIAQAAERCGQFFVNHRWLGGTLTNWTTISESIKTLKKYEDLLGNEEINFTKKERLELDRKRLKLHNVLGGIRNMGGKPDILFVIDVNREKLAIQEAKMLNIPIIAVVDSNVNPDDIDHPIPGNDDANKAIELYTRLASDAVLQGMQENLTKAGVDIGSIEMPDFAAESVELMSFDEVNEQSKKDEPVKVVKAAKNTKLAKKKVEVEIKATTTAPAGDSKKTAVTAGKTASMNSKPASKAKEVTPVDKKASAKKPEVKKKVEPKKAATPKAETANKTKKTGK